MEEGYPSFDPTQEEMDVSRQMPRFSFQDPNLTQWQLSSEDVITWIERDLRGEVYIDTPEFRGWKRPDTGSSFMNERGIRELMSVARNNINKITFLSNLEEEDVFMLTRETHKDLAQLIARRYRHYDLDKAHFTVVIDKIIFMLYPALRRAWQEGERRHLRMVEKRVYSSSETGDMRKSGTSWLNPFGGGKK